MSNGVVLSAAISRDHNHMKLEANFDFIVVLEHETFTPYYPWFTTIRTVFQNLILTLVVRLFKSENYAYTISDAAGKILLLPFPSLHWPYQKVALRVLPYMDTAGNQRWCTRAQTPIWVWTQIGVWARLVVVELRLDLRLNCLYVAMTWKPGFWPNRCLGSSRLAGRWVIDQTVQ